MPNLFRIFKPSRGQLILASLLAVAFYTFLAVQRTGTISAPFSRREPSAAPGKTSNRGRDQVSADANSANGKKLTDGGPPLAITKREISSPRSDSSAPSHPQNPEESRAAAESSGDFRKRDDAFNDPVPHTTDDLQAMEDFIVAQVPQALASTVAIRAYYIQGSGVIVTEDGFVLTAAHVAVKVGQKLDIILADKRQVAGETIYVDHSRDVAVVQLDEAGPWPASPLADRLKLEPGVWCLATGHSGGYSEERPAVVRLGRLIDVEDDYLESDCPLVGGDSGGPLFDMHGRVIGIHSRIGPTVNRNFHAPVIQYQKRWEEIVHADQPQPADAAASAPPQTESSPAPTPALKKPRALLGLFAEDIVHGCRVTEVLAHQPADKGGVLLDDVILKVDQTAILNFNHLRDLIRQKEPGEKVILTIQRDDRLIEEEIVLGSLETSS
ncbi:MAG: S1C family serine protease [Planctomycetaceae bacterium]